MGTIGRVDEICITPTCHCCQCQRQQIIPQTCHHYFPSYFCCEHYGHIICDPNYSSACPFKLTSPSTPPSDSCPPSSSTGQENRPNSSTTAYRARKIEEESKVLEKGLINKNVKLKLKVAIRVGRNPSWNSPKLYFLAIQHALVIIWNTMMTPFTLVAVMGGGNLEKAEAIQSSLFVTAITTILQIEFGCRLPVVMQRSQAFITPAISIAVSANTNCSPTLNHRERFKLSVRRVQGASIVASFFQIIGGFSGARKLFKRGKGALTHLGSAPFVSLTGFGLYSRGYPQLFKCKEIGAPTLVILFFSTQYLPQLWKSKQKKWLVQHFAAVASVIVIWLFTEILTAAGAFNNVAPGTQSSCSTKRYGHISYTPWIKISSPFQWGAPIFDKNDIFLTIVAAFVASVECSGTFTATSRLAGADFIGTKKRALDRAIGFQGIGTLVEAIFGMGHGSTASIEQAGLVGLTEVGSRRVVLLAAVFLLILSILAKFGAFLAAIPLPIVAALHIIFFPYVGTAGVDHLQFSATNPNRSKFTFGASMFAGISLAQHFKGYALASGETSTAPFTPSTRFNDIIQVVFSSPSTIAAIAALIFERIVHREEDLKKIRHKLSHEKEGDDESSSEGTSDDDDDGSSSEDSDIDNGDGGEYYDGNDGDGDNIGGDVAVSYGPPMVVLNIERAKKAENFKAPGMPKVEETLTTKKLLKTKAAEDGTLMYDTLLKLRRSRRRARRTPKAEAMVPRREYIDKEAPPSPAIPISRTEAIKTRRRKIYSLPVTLEDYLS